MSCRVWLGIGGSDEWEGRDGSAGSERYCTRVDGIQGWWKGQRMGRQKVAARGFGDGEVWNREGAAEMVTLIALENGMN